MVSGLISDSVHFSTSLLSVLIQFQFQSHCHSSWWGGDGRLFEFDWGQEGVEVEMGAYSRLGANSRLGAYSNKYGMAHRILHFLHFLK